jgi:ribosomal protein S18 acetylase RimI-like enzyme
MKKARRSDKKIIVDILSTSFDDNKSMNYMVKQDRNRRDRIRHLMDYCFEVCLRNGDIYMSDDEKGCILVIKPERKISFFVRWYLYLKVITRSIGIFNLPRVIRRESTLKKFHPTGFHYYLWLIGVFPEHQNKGIGTKLLKDAIAECDQCKRPMYLETSVERNIPLYERFGFKVFSQVDFGYIMYVMLRGT